MSANMWWGYRHTSGSVQAKRYFGDRASFQEAYESDFVVDVVEPFAANSRDEALRIVAARTAVKTNTGAAMSLQYILNENGEPEPCEDLMKWGRWFETAERHVAKTDIGHVHVSTVFLGLDHAFGGGEPILYETMVFGGPSDGDMQRYATKKEALAGHEAIVKRVNSELQ